MPKVELTPASPDTVERFNAAPEAVDTTALQRWSAYFSNETFAGSMRDYALAFDGGEVPPEAQIDNPYDHVPEDLEDNWEMFTGLRSIEQVNEMAQYIRTKQHNYRVMSDMGFMESLAAGTISAAANGEFLVPSASVMHYARAGRVAASALTGAGIAGGTTAAVEATLHHIDPTRTGEETAFAIGTALVLGGGLSYLGAAGAKKVDVVYENLSPDEKAMVLSSDELTPALRDDSAGAMRVMTDDLDDGVPEIVGVNGKITSRVPYWTKLQKWASPAVASLTSVSPTARRVAGRLIDHDLVPPKMIAFKDADGKIEYHLKQAKRPSVERTVQRISDTRNAQAMGAIDRARKSLKARGVKLNNEQIAERVDRAMVDGDVDPDHAEISEVARLVRGFYDEDLALAQDYGDLPMNLKPKFAKSYAPRYWDFERVRENPKQFKAEVAEELQRRGADAEEAMIEADAIFTKLADSSAGTVPLDVVGSTGRFKERGIDLSDSWLRSRGWVKNNVLDTLEAYNRNVLGEIHLKREFGEVTTPREQLESAVQARDEALAANKAKLEEELNDLPKDAAAVVDETKVFYDDLIDEIRTDREMRLEQNKNIHQAEGQRLRDQIRYVESKAKKGEDKKALSKEWRDLLNENRLARERNEKAIRRSAKKEIAKARKQRDRDLDKIRRDKGVDTKAARARRRAADREAKLRYKEAKRQVDMNEHNLAAEIAQIEREYNELIEAADSPKVRTRLVREKDAEVKRIETYRDKILGRAGVVSNKDMGMGKEAIAALSAYNYMTMLGSMAVSAIPDAARLVSYYGMGGAVRAAPEMVRYFTTGRLSNPQAQEALRSMGVGLEALLGTRMFAIADSGQWIGNRKLRQGQQLFTRYTLMNRWNDAMKMGAALAYQDTLIRKIRRYDFLSDAERRQLANMGFDAEMVDRISSEIGTERAGMLHYTDPRTWTDREAAEQFSGMVYQEVQNTIITPGVGDKPLVMTNSDVGRLLLQFKSFMFGANNRMMLSTLNRARNPREGNVIAGVFVGIHLGMLSSAIRMTISGRAEEMEEWGPEEWIREGVDRYGLFSLPMELYNTTDRLMFGTLSKTMGIREGARFSERDWAGAALGPSAGVLMNFGYIAESLTGDMTAADVRRIRRALPGQNLAPVRPFVNMAEDEVIGALGIEDTSRSIR